MSIRNRCFTPTAAILTLVTATSAGAAPPMGATNLAITLDSKIVIGTLPPADVRVAQPDETALTISIGNSPPRIQAYSCSPDARDLTVICHVDKQLAVWHKGTMSQPYEILLPAVFSPDSSRFAFVAKPRKDVKKVVVVVDGKEEGPYSGVSAEGLHWSPDGKHLAYFAFDDAQNLSLVRDGVLSAQHFRNAWGPFFSPDSQHCMYTAEADGVGLVMDDGQLQGHYNGTMRPLWSPDSKHTAMAVNARQGDKPTVILRDGKLGEDNYAAIADIAYSPDSKTLAYTAKVPHGYQCVVDGEDVGDVIGGHYGGTLSFLPDNKSVRWIGSTSRTTFAYFIDGEKVYEFHAGGIMPMGSRQTFSPDGRHLGLVQYVGDLQELARAGQKKFVAGKDFTAQLLVDKRVFEPFDDVWGITFSRDSQHFAAHVVLGENRQAILADGVQGKVYPKILLATQTFSPDSTHLAYLATKSNGKSVLVVDDMEGPEFEQAVKGTPLVWVDNQTLRFLMIDKTVAESATWTIFPKDAKK